MPGASSRSPSSPDVACRLFTTVLKWQKAEKKWMDGAFLDLNSLQIKDDIDEFSKEMVQLQKLFKSKFKQAALDGESKYSKMNLEDSDPNQLPPPLKICALTNAAIDKFTENIRVISCLCNPGVANELSHSIANHRHPTKTLEPDVRHHWL
jgi:dynein heavy chain